MKITVLLVEDDTDLLNNNMEFLQKHGFRSVVAETLADAAKALKQELIDLILLDVNMPDGSGFDFITETRKTSDVPVIFLTGRAEKADMLEGLNRGGCDYITKPYDFDVLLARIEAQLRKTQPGSHIQCGALTLDTVALQAFLNGNDLLLKPKEFSLLHVLIQNEGATISLDELYRRVWGQPMGGDRNAIKNITSQLRKKLTGSGYTITSEYREGYSFRKK